MTRSPYGAGTKGGSDQPARYEIRVEGHLDDRWSDWFGGMSLSNQGSETLLRGVVHDQPALYGLLDKIRDLGLTITEVKRLSEEDRPSSAGRSTMIARLWRGWTDPGEADAYEILLTETIIPGIEARKIKGLRSIRALRRDRPDLEEVEFMTIMTFDDWASVEAFAGPETNTSVVPDAARGLLKRFDLTSTHYEDIDRR